MGITMDGIELKVGDKVWSTRYGWGKVDGIYVREGNSFPIEVKFYGDKTTYTYTADLKFKTACKRELFWDEVKITPPPKPKQKVKKWRWVFHENGKTYLEVTDGHYTEKEITRMCHIKSIERIDATECLMYEDQNTPETSDDDSL